MFYTRKVSRHYMALWVLLPIVLLPSAVLADEDKHTTVQKLAIPHQVDTTYGIHNYIVQVLTRALEVTQDEYGTFELVREQEAAVQSRQILNLEKGVSDIIWMISAKDREQQSLAIPIPVIGGLYGYRVLLVRERDKRFLLTKKLPELRQLLYAQGPDWPDTRILINNAFNVEEVPYKAGFRMLQRGFVDAYPRAVHEALFELTQPIADGLTIEPYTMLEYPNPLFFYVASWNTELAERLESGLKTMVRTGELQSLLESQAFYQIAYDVLAGRTVYELYNPMLSDTARQAVEEYLDIDEVLEYVSDSTAKKAPPQHYQAKH